MEQNKEKKVCQNCKEDFIIESDDFSFYEKIKVSPPTFCPQCRFIRRLSSTNERVLYKRKCDFSGETIFSMYPEDAVFPVYDRDVWYSDKWDPYKYGMDYDFSKPFFEQFLELRKRVPKMSLVKQGNSINSPFTHRVADMKDSYMVFRTTRGTNSLYVYIGKDILDCVDCFTITQCELCYECIDCDKCYRTVFSQESLECRSSFFLYGCRNCSNCIGCVNLINKEYCIFNEQYSKEEYFEKLKNLKLNTTSGLIKFEDEFVQFKKKFPQRSIVSIKSEDKSGNWLTNCKNVNDSFWCINVKDGKYLFAIFDAEDCMDYFQWGNKSELIYESENCGINSSRLSFCTQCWTGAHDLMYCDSCPSSGNCFGCIGLKKGEYSILNKKYTKEEYEELVPKIIKHMNDMPYFDNNGTKYRFGEHFPASFSAFAYNETAAQDFFPLNKEEVLNLGFKWKDREKKNYTITIKSSELPETIDEVNDSILNEVIECGDKDNPYSVGAYRITSDELNFYRKMNLPLPRECFDVRHMNRLFKRPTLKLQKRNCSHCNIEVETAYTESYAPIIYCEKCYQQEVF
ncbi:MAG: hypothetical protein WC241_00670 [Candidatus Paceibacterota bacterium]|jgi:hypothetical protein